MAKRIEIATTIDGASVRYLGEEVALIYTKAAARGNVTYNAQLEQAMEKVIDAVLENVIERSSIDPCY